MCIDQGSLKEIIETFRGNFVEQYNFLRRLLEHFIKGDLEYIMEIFTVLFIMFKRLKEYLNPTRIKFFVVGEIQDSQKTLDSPPHSVNKTIRLS